MRRLWPCCSKPGRIRIAQMKTGETALLAAAGNGNVATARMLLDAKADVNASRWNGDTPLMAAVNTGNLELVRLLAERGGKVNAAENRMGQTPLMWAEAGRPDGDCQVSDGAGRRRERDIAQRVIPRFYSRRSGGMRKRLEHCLMRWRTRRPGARMATRHF